MTFYLIIKVACLYFVSEPPLTTKYRYNGKNPYFVMVEDALETMTNPFARKLLIDKMAEQ